MTNRTDMINEANEFGLEFPGNISNVKLAAMLAEFKGEPEAVEENAPPSPKSDEPPVQEEVADDGYVYRTPQQIAADRYKRKRSVVAKAKKRALETRIVTITNKDNRENDVMTTAYLSFENQHFGVSKLVPLDIPVELERALIEIAASTTMTLHKDEIVDGKRTGNKVPTTVKKFAISYSRQDPK